jgi:hypothetical protein
LGRCGTPLSWTSQHSDIIFLEKTRHNRTLHKHNDPVLLHQSEQTRELAIDNYTGADDHRYAYTTAFGTYK